MWLCDLWTVCYVTLGLVNCTLCDFVTCELYVVWLYDLWIVYYVTLWLVNYILWLCDLWTVCYVSLWLVNCMLCDFVTCELCVMWLCVSWTVCYVTLWHVNCVLCDLWTVFVVRSAGPTTNTARLSPRYEGKTRGCHCSHWAPDNGRENARKMLSCNKRQDNKLKIVASVCWFIWIVRWCTDLKTLNFTFKF
jgi:hypothetical protein